MGNARVKHSVMVGLMGRQADRFHEYQPARDLAERLEMTGRVAGVEGIEVVYPKDFPNREESVALIKDCGLPVSAVNLNVKAAKKWQSGSFTSPDPALRADAVADLKTAMDLAAELDAPMVTCCTLIDGHNYSFQVDYLKQWEWLAEGISQGARYRDDVKISLEYKPNEARNYCTLGDMGRALYLCEELGFDNVGVTMDVGHALVAAETPAEMVCLAHRAGAALLRAPQRQRPRVGLGHAARLCQPVGPGRDDVLPGPPRLGRLAGLRRPDARRRPGGADERHHSHREGRRRAG